VEEVLEGRGFKVRCIDLAEVPTGKRLAKLLAPNGAIPEKSAVSDTEKEQHE
jgi:hypothetical protein